MGLLSGLFGKSESKVKLPPYIEEASKGALNTAQALAALGYVPNFGPEIAAFTPMQQAAMGNTNQMAQAFGMQAQANPMAGMPQARTTNGIAAYSSAPIMNEAIKRLKQRRPGQYDQIRSIFANLQQQAPQAGQAPGAVQQSPAAMWNGGSDGGSTGPAPTGGNLGFPGAIQSLTGGYTSLRDMIDGGGPGVSGGAFQGGGIYSRVGNLVTGR